MKERKMMENRVHFLVDAFWGSSGKGKWSAVLCDRFNIRHVSACNFPNAGHTWRKDGKRLVFKTLPTAMALHEQDHHMCAWLGPSSGIRLDRLLEECARHGYPTVYVHERACVVSEQHALEEKLRLQQIASTMQGSGAALCDKIWRLPEAIIEGRDVPYVNMLRPHNFSNMLWRVSLREPVLHEVAQGTGLSINHGTEYPRCTFRDCTSMAALSDLGLPISSMGEVFLVVRTYPIRVGNGNGYSGDFWHDTRETSWEQVLKNAGAPNDALAEVLATETTTVTGRIRRVSHISWDWLEHAAHINSASRILVSFIEYVNWADRGCKDFLRLSSTSRAWIDMLEETIGIKVMGVSTGPEHSDVAWAPGG